MVDAPLTTFGSGPGGKITGMAFIGSTLYAVSDAGGFYEITNYGQPDFKTWPDISDPNDTHEPREIQPIPNPNGAALRFIGAVESDQNAGEYVQFAGLTLGPQNVEEGSFAQTLFAVSRTGDLYALSPQADSVVKEGIFVDAQTSVTIPGVATASGLAFSTLDYNMWHVTDRRADDDGHDVNATYDYSRAEPPPPEREDLPPGGASYYFGYEVAGNYDAPGGAYGSLTTQAFSLQNYTKADAPTLYFDYFLDNGDNTVYDSARVFASADGVNWYVLGATPDNPSGNLVDTNGLWLQTRLAPPEDPWMYGNNQWIYQYSLADFAGSDAVYLRFDFSTAGDMNVGDTGNELDTTGAYLQALDGEHIEDGDFLYVDGHEFDFDMGMALRLPNVAGDAIPDGETFSIMTYDVNGDLVPLRTFEFDKGDGHVADGNVPIAIEDGQTTTQVAAAIVRAVNNEGLVNENVVGIHTSAPAIDPSRSDEFSGDTSAFLGMNDATPSGTIYMVFDDWGGTAADAEQSSANDQDDNMSWAAAASNVLEWTGWGNVDGMTTADEYFQYMQDHWTDEASIEYLGWEWWFSGDNLAQGYPDYAQVDVPGGGFYPDRDMFNYLTYEFDQSKAMSSLDGFLHDGYGCTVNVLNNSTKEVHELTAWGFDYDATGNYLGIYVTDSMDDESIPGAPDRLRYYQVEWSPADQTWHLKDYQGSDNWDIYEVYGLKAKAALGTTGPIVADYYDNRVMLNGAEWVEQTPAPNHTDPTIELVGNGFGTYSGTPITITSMMSSDEVAQAIGEAFDNYFAGGAKSFVVQGSTVRMIHHAVDYSGPLPYAYDLPGDLLTEGFNSILRGQDNAHEGFYIDNIVVGFAERGEMATQSPVGDTNFTFTNPDTIITTGYYQLQVRKASEYATWAPDYLYPMTLDRSFDINDRFDDSYTLTTVSANDISQGSTFVVSDGVTPVTFQFLDENVQSGNPDFEPVYFSKNMTASEVAHVVTDAVNAAAAAGLFNVTATMNEYSNLVDLFGAAKVTTPRTSPSDFNITLQFDGGLTASQQAIFEEAAYIWESIIVGDIPDVQTTLGLVDDIVIDASGIYIDGQGGILGQAGPTGLRNVSYLPYSAQMQFDTADLAQLEADGQLLEVITHEMGHSLGFGTIWSDLGLLIGAGTSDPEFIGAGATAEYNAIFGLTASSVPVESTGGPGTADAHWRETVFDNELMTGWINSGVNPLSRITAASMGDIGYQVNLDAAQAYLPPSSPPLPTNSSTAPARASTSWKSSICRARTPMRWTPPRAPRPLRPRTCLRRSVPPSTPSRATRTRSTTRARSSSRTRRSRILPRSAFTSRPPRTASGAL